MQNITRSPILLLVLVGMLLSIASVSGLHPLKADTDGDGMPDGWEVEHGLNPNNAGDASIDYNYNGLTNFQEYKKDYSPWDMDTDDDGISNYAESTGLFGFFTDPLVEDTDDDGLSDLQEICVYVDTDNRTQMDELFPNEIERENARAEITNISDKYCYKLDPTNSDTDYDGLGDGDEISKGASPTCMDSDNDGIRDGEEVYVYQTDPTLRDTDGDGLLDSEEIFGTYGFVSDPTNEDSDEDGIPDGEECLGFGIAPIAPSRYAMSYEEFIRGNEYENETITLKARVDKIKYGSAQTNYSIFLKPLEYDLTQGKIGVARIDNSWHYDLEYGLRHVDDRFGFSLYEGDTIVIVGKAGGIVGITREIVVDSDGKLYLIVSPEEARRRWLPSNEYIRILSKLTNVTTLPSPTITPTPTPESSPIPNSTTSSLDANETEVNKTANATAPALTPTPEFVDTNKGVSGLLGYGAISIVIVIATLILYIKFGDRIPIRKKLKENKGGKSQMMSLRGQNTGTRKEWS